METELYRVQKILGFCHLNFYEEPQKCLQHPQSFIMQQHHLPSFIRACVTCSSAPAHTERVQDRAEHTADGMGCVSTGRAQTWEQK